MLLYVVTIYRFCSFSQISSNLDHISPWARWRRFNCSCGRYPGQRQWQVVGAIRYARACSHQLFLTDGNKIPLIIQIIVYGLLALLSVFGWVAISLCFDLEISIILNSLIGAIFKRRRLVTLYVAMLAVHLIFSIASGVYSIYQLFIDSKTTVDDCVNGSTDKDTIEGCQKGVTLIKALMIILFIVVWLIELCGYPYRVFYSREPG